ncbi:MAG TPA: hypothetical protein VGQ62_07420, partial [Chloroflexota bacterium]|nr:hypothetical protein [Chloroflexota bacterium]
MPTLLTGVGYIGAVLLRRLVEQPGAAPVVALENFFCTPRADVLAALPAGVTLVEGDAAEPIDVARAFDALPSGGLRASTGAAPVTVFHLAAQPSAAVAV